MTLHKLLKRQSVRRGFTLMEILIVVAIIVVLAGVGTMYLLPQLDSAKEDSAKIRMKELEKALMAFKAKHGTYPDTLNSLTIKLQDGSGPYIEPDGLNDPWGHPYMVDTQGTNNQGVKPDVSFNSPVSNRVIGNWPGGK